MPSLYEQLMNSKGAPRVAGSPNSTQLHKAPMNLRSAMQGYAEGGDISNLAAPEVPSVSAAPAVPDYSRAYGALGGAEGVNALRNQLLGMGISEDIIGSAFSKYYAPEAPQPQTMTPFETMSPPEPMRPPPPEEPRYQPATAEPRYEEPRRPEPPVMPEVYPQDYAGPRTTGSTQTQQVGPRTSYRINDDGSSTEIGYDGQPVANYTPEQLAMHNATTGVTPSEYRYVWNGEGYDKLPNSPQTGYGQGIDSLNLQKIGRETLQDPRDEEPLPQVQYGGQPQPPSNNVLSGNIMAGASWNSLNPTLADQLTQATGQSTLNTAVGGATTEDTLNQLNEFLSSGGAFAPGSNVFLQTGGVDLVSGIDKDTVQSNIDKIISILEDQGANVVLTGSPYAASFGDVQSNNFNPELDSIYGNIAGKHKNVALVDSMGRILQDKSLLSDPIHPNKQGWEVYNQSVLDALRSLSRG